MLLKQLYELAQSRGLLDDLAFAAKPVKWVIPLDHNGELLVPGLIETASEKGRGKEIKCPRIIGDTNSGKIADFLAEGLDGMFGLSPDPKKPKDAKKLAAKHQHFWDQISNCFQATKEPLVEALLKFHQQLGEDIPPFLRIEEDVWTVIPAHGKPSKLGNDEFTFSVGGKLLIENEQVINYWRTYFAEMQKEGEEDSDDLEQRYGVCLVTGEYARIARTHSPKVKKVPNTQGSGAKIVSFEKSSLSFSSFGLMQSYNAPVSEQAATAYCVAMNWLLDRKNHSLRIGQTAVCFWAQESEEVTDFLAAMLDRPQPEQVHDFLTSPWAGVDRQLLQHNQFYSVTLSGNAGRIAMRHWMQATAAAARENLRQWFTDLKTVIYGDLAMLEKSKKKELAADGKAREAPQPLALYSLAVSTVRESKDLQAETLTQLYRAALEGQAPSVMLLKATLDRIKIDLAKFGDGILMTPIRSKTQIAIREAKQPMPPPGQSRFALLRLILNRNRKGVEPMIEPQVFDTDDTAYNCGRLMAVLSEAQQKAHDYKLEGAGVAERYFGTASSSPASVFPLLIRLNRHHLNKISKSDRYKGHERFLEEAIQKILSLFRPEGDHQPPRFPRALNLQAQGRFALGFYQQQAADDAARRAARADKNANYQLDSNS